MWLPRELVPTNATVMAPPSPTSVTEPAMVIVSPGWFDAPSPILRFRNTARSPAQSPSHRAANPLEVRMFMMMSGRPLARAASLSWWTSWWSKVASAPDVTSSVVMSIGQGGNRSPTDTSSRTNVSVRRSGRTGRNWWRVTSSWLSSQQTSSGMPISSWSGRTPTMLETTRTPSSSSTRPTTSG